MRELGRVVAVRGGLARVAITPKGGCDHCGLKGICQPGRGDRELEVLNPLQAEPGDLVQIEVAARSAVGATLLVYILPLTTFLIGTWLGGHWFKNDSYAALLGFGFFGLTFLSLKILDKRLGRRFRPRIVEVLKHPE